MSLWKFKFNRSTNRDTSDRWAGYFCSNVLLNWHLPVIRNCQWRASQRATGVPPYGLSGAASQTHHSTVALWGHCITHSGMPVQTRQAPQVKWYAIMKKHDLLQQQKRPTYRLCAELGDTLMVLYNLAAVLEKGYLIVGLIMNIILNFNSNIGDGKKENWTTS